MTARYIVCMCGNDKKVHVFTPRESGKQFWFAECGHSVPTVQVLPATQASPSCIPCLIAFGTAEADHLATKFGFC